MHALNTREKKQLLLVFKEQWGFSGELPHLLVNTEGKVYATTAEIGILPRMRVDMVGLCIGSFERDGFSLTIEGSQVIGPRAAQNIVNLADEEAATWLRGEDLHREGYGYMLLRHGADFLGSGKASGGKIHNRVPKTRRLPYQSG